MRRCSVRWSASRASCAGALWSAGNDDRLGGDEAPPAIILVFLGDMLTDIPADREAGSAKTTSRAASSHRCLGSRRSCRATRAIATAPARLPLPARVRFPRRLGESEHRAPECCAQRRGGGLARLLRDGTREGAEDGKTLPVAVKGLLTKLIKDNKQIIFNGNNYADEWQKDAAKRGLLNHRTSVDALARSSNLTSSRRSRSTACSTSASSRHVTRSPSSRSNKTVNIEAQLMVLMANRYILPAAYQFAGELAQTVAAMKAAGVVSKETKKTLETVTKLTDEAKGTSTSCRGSRARGQRRHRQAREVLPRQGDSVDDGAPRCGRRAGRHRAARCLAASDVSRDVVRQVAEVDGRRSTVDGRLQQGPGSLLWALSFWSQPVRAHYVQENVTGGAG